MASSLFTSFIISALLLLSGTASAAIYKWTDDSGLVHYGSMPPQGIRAQKMGVDTTYTPAPPKKSTTPDAKNNKASDEKAGTEPGKKDEYSQQQHDTLCKNAKNDIATMNKSGRLRVKQEDGSTAVLSDKDRDARLKRMQAMAAKHCK